jgi:sorbose reductase
MASSSVATLNPANDAYLNANVFDLFSLKERVVVITGGARGIGLALGFAVAEAGGVPVMIDAMGQPHEHFQILQKMCPKMKLYVLVQPKSDSLSLAKISKLRCH